jgi:hypothetical protein
VCVVGRHRVQQSLKTQCDADRSTGLVLALALAFASFAFGPRRIASIRDIPAAAHATSCMHACMADSSSAWWRCLASDPGRDAGHSRQLFRPLAAGSESKQPSPASHQEQSAEADFNAPRQAYRDIAHRPSPRQRRAWQYAWTAGQGGDVVCRSANSCRLSVNCT